jgi:ectoine hydroxylase-related dioxygenase (phytanoyl-CoA dioxygenase family)
VLVGVAAMSDRYRQLSEDPRILDRIAPLMPEGITFLSDKFVYKNGSQRFATPWHTDNQYWANRRPKLSVWIPLDDVNAHNGTLKIVPGSHAKQWRQVQVTGEETNGEFRNRVDETAIPTEDVVVVEVPRGTLVVFSDALLHASTPNVSGQDRYAIISTYHETQEPETETVGPASKVLTRR